MEGGKVNYARRKVTTAKVMVKAVVNYTRSKIRKFRKYVQVIKRERSIYMVLIYLPFS